MRVQTLMHLWWKVKGGSEIATLSYRALQAVIWSAMQQLSDSLQMRTWRCCLLRYSLLSNLFLLQLHPLY